MLIVYGAEEVPVFLREESQGQVRRGYNFALLLFDALLRPPRVCSLSK